MPDQKISQLTAGGAAQATDLLPVARGATNVSLLAKDIATALERLAASGQSLTGAQATSLVDLAATWNTTGTPTAIKLNVTDTASNAASLLMDLQVGGTSRFSVNAKSGQLSIVKPNTTGFQSVAAISLRAPQNETQSRFISFFGPSSSTEEGFIASEAGHTGVFFQATRIGANDVRVLYGTANGSQLTTGGLRFSSGNSIGWGPVNSYDTPDLILARDAADTLAQRRTTSAQTFRLYNTFTDASNYERGKLEWASNVLRIGTEKAGTGTARALELQTDGTTRVTVHPTDGTVTIGGYVFNDPTYGIRRTAGNSLTLTGGTTGNAGIDCAATFVGVNAIVERNWANAQIRFDDITSTTIAAVALRNGTQPQRLHVYSTFTSTTSYERLTVAAQTAAAFQIRTNKGSGGGTARALELGTDDTTRLTVKVDGQTRFIPLTADPANAEDGDVYYNSTTNKLRVRAGGAWVDLH